MSKSKSKCDIISFKKAVIIGVLILIGYNVMSFVSYYFNELLSYVIAPIIGFLSVLCLFYAAIRSRSHGNRIYYAWLLIALGQLFFTMGDVFWAFLGIFLNVNPFPSPADFLYIFYYVFFAFGIFLLLRPLENPEMIYRTILDCLIVIVSAILIFSYSILSFDILTHNQTMLAFSLSSYYIIRDFVIFSLLVNLTLRYVDRWMRDPLLLLTSAILVLLITDAVFYYQFLYGTYTGHLTYSGWLLSYILIGLAGILYGNRASVKLPKTAFRMQKAKKYIKILLASIWVSIGVYMIFWGYYNLSSTNFFKTEIKVIIFFILLIIRLTITITEKRHVYLKILIILFILIGSIIPFVFI